MAMVVVIFRATLRPGALSDPEYSQTAARMRELALTEFGCVEFQAVCEGKQEVALSWWPDEAAITAWKAHPEHKLAQQIGRERWYENYAVQVANVTRDYRIDALLH
jgi:heme-degrading monooxygenase HmoA